VVLPCLIRAEKPLVAQTACKDRGEPLLAFAASVAPRVSMAATRLPTRFETVSCRDADSERAITLFLCLDMLKVPFLGLC